MRTYCDHKSKTAGCYKSHFVTGKVLAHLVVKPYFPFLACKTYQSEPKAGKGGVSSM